jgi:hypothetical protein
MACALAFSLYFGRPGDTLIWWIALYVLLDATTAALRDIVAGPIRHRDEHGGYIEVYDRTRWLFMAVINVVQVVLCFSVFALYYGAQFEPAISDALSAIYFSSVTFLTVGYGDIRPTCPKTQALVCWELLGFLLFLVVKLPIAVSVLRVKENRDK